MFTFFKMLEKLLSGETERRLENELFDYQIELKKQRDRMSEMHRRAQRAESELAKSDKRIRFLYRILKEWDHERSIGRYALSIGLDECESLRRENERLIIRIVMQREEMKLYKLEFPKLHRRIEELKQLLEYYRYRA